MPNVTFKGQNVELLGSFPQIGENAPDFVLVGADLSEISLSSFIGKKVILNIFPSIDTPTCAISVQKFNQAASEKATVLCISADLPFAAGRFCAAENINNVVTASFFRAQSFTEDYGVKLTGLLAGLAARAVLVVNEEGKVIHAELVSEIADEPDYEAALKAVQ